LKDVSRALLLVRVIAQEMVWPTTWMPKTMRLLSTESKEMHDMRHNENVHKYLDDSTQYERVNS
jgi:hypothetical protein